MALDVLLEVNPSHAALSDERADPCLRVVENDVIGGVLGHLTPGQARVVRARVIEGRSTQEIAADWGVSRERVRGLYKRGMARLRGSASSRALLEAA
jgi:RNA polymerase sigma factor (sigma-70 family)